MNVKTISRDLASNYDWVCRENFMNAIAVADKFHIIKLVIQAVQDQRIEYRHQEKAMRIEQEKQHNIQEEITRLEFLDRGKIYTKRKFKSDQVKYSNGETNLQLLQRSRGLLFKPRSTWYASQKQRATILFALYPTLEELYQLSETFRKWMSRSNIGKSRALLEKQIKKWFRKVDLLDNFFMKIAKTTIKKNLGVIMNYFYEGVSNASAENLNRHIKRFASNLFGIRDMDFFFFRLAIYYA